MYALEKTRTTIKVLFHLTQIVVITSGVVSFLSLYLLLLKSDSLIPLPSKYVFPITAISILAVGNGLLGLSCLNSDRRTKVFLFVLTLSALMNIQILLAISSNRMLDRRVQWMNERWSRLTTPQKQFIQQKFKCCGLETTSDRTTAQCDFSVPCGAVIKGILRTLRNVSQSALVYMFFIESVSLCSLVFLKFIK